MNKSTNSFNTSNVSNGYFISICKEGAGMLLLLNSGVEIECTYINSDKYTVLIRREDSEDLQLVYKHAIESVQKIRN